MFISEEMVKRKSRKGRRPPFYYLYTFIFWVILFFFSQEQFLCLFDIILVRIHVFVVYILTFELKIKICRPNDIVLEFSVLFQTFRNIILNGCITMYHIDMHSLLNCSQIWVFQLLPLFIMINSSRQILYDYQIVGSKIRLMGPSYRNLS